MAYGLQGIGEASSASVGSQARQADAVIGWRRLAAAERIDLIDRILSGDQAPLRRRLPLHDGKE